MKNKKLRFSLEITLVQFCIIVALFGLFFVAPVFAYNQITANKPTQPTKQVLGQSTSRTTSSTPNSNQNFKLPSVSFDLTKANVDSKHYLGISMMIIGGVVLSGMTLMLVNKFCS